MTGRRAFFKILINDFSKRLRIPPAFTKNIRAKSPKGFTLTSFGKHWHVEVNKIGNDLFIEKGWRDFVRDHSLRHGNLLIFRHHHDFKFDVEVFETNGCDKVDDLADRNHDNISPCVEGLEPKYARKYLANDRTNKVTDSSISGKVNGGLVIGNDKQRSCKVVMPEGTNITDEAVHVEIPHVSENSYANNYSSHEDCDISPAKMRQNILQRPRKKMSTLNHSVHHKSELFDGQDVRESVANGKLDHISREKQAEHCDVYIVSSSTESENDQRQRKKMKIVRHSLPSDQRPYSRRVTRKSAALNKCTHVIYGKKKGNQDVRTMSYAGKMNDCKNEANVIRRSLRRKFIQANRRDREPVSTEKVECPVHEKENESHEVDSASSDDTDYVEPANGSDSQSSFHSFLADVFQNTTPQENERDDYPSSLENAGKFSASFEKKVGANLNENASVEETVHSLHSEHAHKSSCEQTSKPVKCSYMRFSSNRRSVTQEEKDCALKAARNFITDKPSFIIVLKPTHVYGGFVMSIPHTFVEAHISKMLQHVLLTTTSSNQKWLVKCLVKKHNKAKLGKGWPDFVWDNNLEEGDACLFELDKSNGVGFRVHIFRVVEEVEPLCRIRDMAIG